jgi:hypothetical protein
MLEQHFGPCAFDYPLRSIAPVASRLDTADGSAQLAGSCARLSHDFRRARFTKGESS